MIRNYVTLKTNNEYFRILRIDEGKDGSIYIKRNPPKYFAKQSYHETNLGSGFRRHQKIVNKEILESRRYSNKKLIEQRQVFFVYNCNCDKLPKNYKVVHEKTDKKDLIFKVLEPITRYKILISVNRNDLLKETEFIQTKKLDIQSGNFYVTLYQK